MKPATPILRNEHYLDVMTGGSADLPTPILREEKYLAKLAGMEVDIPSPITTKEKYYAKICGMDVDVPTYTRNMPRIYAYMAKAAGQTIEDLPTAVTREQRYWYDYVSEPPVTEHEYTGAVPYTFNANGEPLLDWSIYGNTVQSTTPTPDNPVMPNGCGDMTGNLFNTADVIYGTWTGSSGGTSVASYAARTQNLPASSLAVSVNSETIPYSYSIIWVDSNDTFIWSDHIGSKSQIPLPQTFSPPNDAVYFYMQVSCGSTQSDVMTKAILDSYKVMLNTGSALPYEPFGVKIPISSAGQTTPVYLGEVQTTRQIQKIVFDGTENWQKASSGSIFYIADVLAEYLNAYDKVTCISSHYDTQANVNWAGAVENKKVTLRTTSSAATTPPNALYIGDSAYSTITDFVTYLQQQYANGNPVCVWYVLATETTGIVNEPLMKIGDYADRLTATQAGVTIPTNNGSTTIDVETAVKPSEVYIKWKGV